MKKYAAKHKIDYVRIYGDDSSGKDFIRREWIQLEKALHEGDTIVFKDLSRFTRQAEEGYQKYLDLIGKGITLVFIDNPTVCSDYITKLINTADQQNIVTRTAMEGIVKLMLIVELDRADIHSRRMKKVFPLREYYIEKHTAGSTGDCLTGQTDG